MLATASFFLLAAAPVAPPGGEVKLPLRDYLALVERVEAADAARGRASRQSEPSVAELVSQRVSLTIEDASAEVLSSFEVELRGRVSETVTLPLTGVAGRITVEPPGAAAVSSAPGGLALVATSPGRYRIQVSGREALARSEGVERLVLAPMPAAVAEAVVSLPADRAWRCPKAVVAEDAVSGGRRTLRLALPRGEPAVLELRRDVKAAEPPQAVAAAVVVTVVSLGRDTVRRHDVVLYEVQRGDLATLAVTLPQGLEPDAVATDEGAATPWLEGRTLRVERQRRLAGLGYLAVVSQPASREAVSLEPVTLQEKVRARYLAYASDIAAGVAPEPAASWVQVDLSDLPQPVHEAAGALGLVAAWRLRPAAAPGQLKVAALSTYDERSSTRTQRRRSASWSFLTASKPHSVPTHRPRPSSAATTGSGRARARVSCDHPPSQGPSVPARGDGPILGRPRSRAGAARRGGGGPTSRSPRPIERLGSVAGSYGPVGCQTPIGTGCSRWPRHSCSRASTRGSAPRWSRRWRSARR